MVLIDYNNNLETSSTDEIHQKKENLTTAECDVLNNKLKYMFYSQSLLFTYFLEISHKNSLVLQGGLTSS